MNKNAKAWVKALRSGKYTQGTGKLSYQVHNWKEEEDVVKHCCLGVACVLYKESHPEWPVYLGDSNEYAYGNNRERFNLPPEVMKWLNINDTSGKQLTTNDSIIDSLASMNDGGATYDDIADVIEQENPGLFNTKKSIEKWDKLVKQDHLGANYVA